MKVVGSLSVDGTFWCVPEFSDQIALRAISDRLRKETLREKLYWNCDASKKDQMICVLSKTHNLWLRGIIEKTCSNNDVLLRYIDIGKTEKVAKSRLNCIPENMKDLETLALFCCFQKEPIEVSYDMKWKFKDLTSNSLAVTIKEEIKDGVLSRFVVSIRDPTNDSGDIFQVICKEAQSQNTAMANKDMRIYGNVPGNHGQLSIVQEVHNAKQKPEEAPRKEEVLEQKSETPCKEIDQEDNKPKGTKPDLNIDVEEPGGGEPNWADLCKTPDVITNEEQEFLPVDESIFDSSDKDDEPEDKEPQSSSGQGKLESSAEAKAVVNDKQTSNSSGTKKSADNKESGDRIPSEPKTEKSVDDKEGEDQQASSETKVNASGELDQNKADALRMSQQVMEERLRAAEELSKKKSLAEKSIEDAKTDPNSNTALDLDNVSHGKLDARSDDSAVELLKEDGTSNEEAACPEGEGSLEHKHNSQVNEKTISEEPDVPAEGDDSSSKDKDKAPSNEGKSRIEEKGDEEPTNSEVSSKFENCSVQGSSSKNSEIETNKGLDSERNRYEKLETTKASESPKRVSDNEEIKIAKGMSNKSDSTRKPEGSSNKDTAGSCNDVRRTAPFKVPSGSADDFKTLPNEDREQWNREQLKGLQHTDLDNRYTKFFVIDAKPSDLADSFRTNRFLLTSLSVIGDVLNKHFPRPVVFFMLSQTPTNVKRLCAIALAKSKPYKFDVRNKAGEWHVIELFNLQYLCKARSRRTWNHTFEHQDELRRAFANRILGEYARSIRKGFIDKLQDDETQMKNQVCPVRQDTKFTSIKWKAPPSSGSDSEQKKFVRQNSGSYEMPPRMSKDFSRKNRTGTQSTSAESESDGERINGASSPSIGETGLKVNVDSEREKDWFAESRELWSPISTGSQGSTNFAPTSTVENDVQQESMSRQPRQQKETNRQVQQFFADFEKFAALQKLQQQQQPLQQHQRQQPMQQQQQPIQQQQQPMQQQQQQQMQLFYQYQQFLKQQQQLPYQQQQFLLYQQQQQQQWQQQKQQQQQQQQMFHMFADFMRQQRGMMVRQQSPPPVSQAGFQPFPLQPQHVMRMPVQIGDAGLASRSTTFGTKAPRVDDFGSGDEAERDLMKDCDIFGLDEDELRS